MDQISRVLCDSVSEGHGYSASALAQNAITCLINKYIKVANHIYTHIDT